MRAEKQLRSPLRPRFPRPAALDRAGILTLGRDVAIDEFDHGQRRVVAIAEAGLQDARIAAVTILVTRAENVEELAEQRDILICAIA